MVAYMNSRPKTSPQNSLPAFDNTNTHLSNTDLCNKDLSNSIPSSNVALTTPSSPAEPIAICGMALRLPGGIINPAQFWEFLLSKKDARSQVPKSRYNIDGHYSNRGKPGSIKSKYGYFLDDSIDLGALDTSFFSMPKVELECQDPQQRQLLEVTRECFESAGEVNYRGKDIGCWVGSFGEDWCESSTKDQQNYGVYRVSGWGDFALSNRISYEYDLKGPSMTVRTGCSSSLVGFHEACLAIRCGECSAAIVGGANLIMAPGMTTIMTEQGVLSPEGSCKTFDMSADGYARGEAINVVYIKRLSDALRDGNPIRAIIRATSSNCDGKTVGITQPSSESHEAMIRRAYFTAGINEFSDTGFIECHGTGTQTGDPIEVTAVGNVFGEKGVYIGSVKPNVGHSEGASGISSLIKAVLALENRTIPPNIKFNNPNPKIPWREKKLCVPTEPTPWPQDRVERVGVNSFGIGGANVHVIIDSTRSYLQNFESFREDDHSTQTHLMLYSANTPDSLRRQVINFQQYLNDNPNFSASLAYTLANRREHLPHRAFSIVGPATAANTSSFTKAPTSSPGVIMVFTGQGAQWAQMGLELLENNAIFKDSIRAMDDTLRNLSDAPGWSIEEELAKPTLSSNLASAVYSQPLCTAIQIALVDVLRVIGVQPYAVVGHSSGEMAAAYAGGRLTAREAIIAAYYRGVVSGQVSTLGCMAAIGMSFDETAQYLEDGVVIACENSPSSVTISGDLKPVNNVLSKIQASNPDVLVRVLKVDKAYHSHHMKEVGPTYLCLSKHHIKGNVVSPSSPIFFSSVSGKQLLRKQILGANYWQLNLESPVLFRTAMANLLSHLAENGNDKNLLFLEVGPHSALQGPLRQILAQVAINAPYISSLVRGKNSEEALLSAVGQLHLQNVRIKFSTLTNPNGNAKVLTDVPTYPWEHNASYIYESRLSKEWRLRKFSKHELLGLRVAESTDSEPVWRNMFHIDHAAWIRDHNIKGDIIYPCAGYVAMVGEAVRQLATSNSKNDEAFVGYGMSDIIVSTALVLSETKPTEIITSLKKHRLTDSLDSSWWEFTVSSYNGSGWMKHCSGLVLARMGEEIQSENPIDPMPRSVESVRWYDTMRRMGANYGPYFQGLTNITSATTYNSAVAQTIDTSDKDDDSFYTTHPTQIDFFLQLFTVAHAKGINRNASHKAMVPTGIDELDVFISDNNLTMEIMTTSSLQGTICGGGKAITKDRGLALRVKGVTLTPLEGDDTDQVQDPHAAARLEWQPDIDFVDSAKLIKSTVDRKVYFAKLSKLTEFCIAESLYRLSGVTTSLPHLEKFREWMQKRSSAELTKRSNLMTDIQSIVAELSSTPAVPIIIPMMKVLDNIVEIFTGKAEPVEILMADQTLTKLYNFMDEGDRSLFIQTLGHSKPNMRVLEIGAGTGGTTHTILQNLRHSNGNLLYSKYTFTDISSGFFSAAKNRFDQYPNIEFATLDISKDPLGQNFEPHSYDLIIATNVLHATPSLCETLGHVHTLLHPEGRLLMQELCSNDKSGNFIMGVLPGWWLGDADNRSEEPYVSPERWDEELKSAGFRGLDAVVYDAPESMHMGAFMVARPEQIQHQDQTRKVAILYDDNSLQLAEQFQHILMDKKCSITLFCLGDTVPENHDILSVVDVRKPFFEALSEETLNSFQSFISATVNSGVFWVTGSSQMGCEDPSFAQSIGAIRSIRSEFCMDFATCEVDNIDSSVSKVVQVFEKFLNCRQYETQQQNYEYVASKDMVYISRFYPFSLSKELQTPVTASEKESALNLTIAKYGRLGTLQWTPRPFRELGSDEVDIDIGAVGMNFKDILIAMGIVGSNSASLGLEGAGIVKNVGSEVTNMVVGDRVLVFGAGCFSTSLIVPETLCAKIPDDLSLEDAATMPCVFSTVIYSLLHIGQLKKGMSVLIHSACGGVGIAAIQLCRVLGAEIFCTVSNEEKVQYLISTFALPRHRIFNSRDGSFLPGVLRETNGVGVDLVLNSLSGELLHASWKCVAEFGTMLEIGKRDLIGKGKLAMEIFEANRNYCGIDLAHLIEAKPALGKKLLQEIVQFYCQGKIQPIRPIKQFTANEVENCFRYMQKGIHIGKIVLSLCPEESKSLSASSAAHSISFNPDASYVLIGGLGGLGKAVSTWMVENGARHLVYLSRNAGKSPDDEAFFNELESQDCSTRVVQGSVVKEEDVRLALKQNNRPIKGIFQMSMVLRDQAFLRMTHEEWMTAVQPKVQGTWNLHNVALELGLELDFFVMFSSLSGIIGQLGQANYSAGNTFLDAFVQYRQRKNLPASVINIGVIEDSGYLVRNVHMLRKLHAAGQYGIREPELLDALSQAVGTSTSPRTNGNAFINSSQTVIGLRSTMPLSSPQNRLIWRTDRRMAFYCIEMDAKSGNAAANGNTDKLREFIETASNNPTILSSKISADFLARQIAARLYIFLLKPIEDESEIDITPSLSDVGLDSLVAIEMRAWWRQAFGFDISVLEMLGMGSIAALGKHAADGLMVKFEEEEGKNHLGDTDNGKQRDGYLAMKAP